MSTSRGKPRGKPWLNLGRIPRCLRSRFRWVVFTMFIVTSRLTQVYGDKMDTIKVGFDSFFITLTASPAHCYLSDSWAPGGALKLPKAMGFIALLWRHCWINLINDCPRTNKTTPFWGWCVNHFFKFLQGLCMWCAQTPWHTCNSFRIKVRPENDL